MRLLIDLDRIMFIVDVNNKFELSIVCNVFSELINVCCFYIIKC